MLSRRTLLALSILLSLGVHALFLALAPRVLILRAHPIPTSVLESFRVQLREPEQQPPTDVTSELISRPGAVEDLLNREAEELSLAETAPEKTVELAELAERLAVEGLQREYDLVPDAGILQKVDAKIIEIAQNEARRDIEVVRRLVRPSPDRLLGEGEFPTLRGPDDDERAVKLGAAIPRVGSTLQQDAQTPGGMTAAEGGVTPPYEGEVLRPEVVEAKALPLPIEHKVMRAPIVDEVREESPYEFMDELVNIKLDTYMPKGADRGYFRLRIVPKESESIEVLPKDVTFIVDASNSILQRKLDETARGVKAMVGALRPEDRFNIVVFRDSGNLFRPETVPATPENKEAALRFVDGLQSRGQTDVYKGIRPVLENAPRPGVPGIVMLMTDGRPTTGVRDGRTIINALTAENKSDSTIFAYGGGNTVNQYLLDLLAYRNKGESHFTDRLEDIDAELPEFFGQLSDPILVGLEADYGRIDGTRVFPTEVPDFYRGRAVTVYGQFDPKQDREFSMRLTGKAGSRKKELIFKADLSKAESGDDQIARNWAFQKIYYLIGEICRVGEKPELLDELRRLSREYGIRTSYDE